MPKKNITLVISDWHDSLSTKILSQIDSSVHPFSNVILMVPNDLAPQNIPQIFDTKLSVSIHKRKNDYFDICNAPIKTDWFMITNAYYVLSDYVDLLFSNDKRKIPVIPFTPVNHINCFSFISCRKAYDLSKLFNPDNKMVFQDIDMLFNTAERDNFCKNWLERFGENTVEYVSGKGVIVEGGKGIGPSATTYVSYLSAQDKLNNLYDCTDRTIFGKRNLFKRIVSVDEEIASREGETVLSRYILRQNHRSHFFGSPAGNGLAHKPPSYQLPQTEPPQQSPVQVEPPQQSPVQAEPPQQLPVDIGNNHDPSYQNLGCRSYCKLIKTDWLSDDPKVDAKCQWNYTCSLCDECFRS